MSTYNFSEKDMYAVLEMTRYLNVEEKLEEERKSELIDSFRRKVKGNTLHMPQQMIEDMKNSIKQWDKKHKA